MCAVDNLNKGAAGGAVQWMNRMFGLPETAGSHGARARLDLRTRHEHRMHAKQPDVRPAIFSRRCSRSIRSRSIPPRACGCTNARRRARARSVWRPRRGGARLRTSGLDARARPRRRAAAIFRRMPCPCRCACARRERLVRFSRLRLHQRVLRQQRRGGERERAEAGLPHDRARRRWRPSKQPSTAAPPRPGAVTWGARRSGTASRARRSM